MKLEKKASGLLLDISVIEMIVFPSRRFQVLLSVFLRVIIRSFVVNDL